MLLVLLVLTFPLSLPQDGSREIDYDEFKPWLQSELERDGSLTGALGKAGGVDDSGVDHLIFENEKVKVRGKGGKTIFKVEAPETLSR